MDHAVIYKGYIQFRIRNNSNIEFTAGLRYQKSMSCDCKACRQRQLNFESSAKGGGRRMRGVEDFLPIEHGQYYVLTPKGASWNLVPVPREQLIPDPDIVFQSVVEEDNPLPVS